MENIYDVDGLDDRSEVFKASLYLPKINPKLLDIDGIFNILQSPGKLKTLPPETIFEYCSALAAYSLYITEQENKYTMIINWCESNIKFIVGREADNWPGYFSEKDIMIRAHVPAAEKLGKQKMKAQANLDLLKNMSYKISYWTDVLKGLAIEKKKVNRL